MDLDCKHCQNQVHAYVAGELSETDISRFEAHILHCGDCLSEFQVEKRMARGMRALAAREAARNRVPGGVLGWLFRQNQLSQAGLLAAAVLIAVLIPVSWQVSEGLRKELSKSQGREHELAEALRRQQEALKALSLEGQQAQGIITNAFPIRVSTVRNSHQTIEIDKAATQITLEIPQTPDFDYYRFVMENQAGLEIFRANGLYPGSGETLMLTLPVKRLTTGLFVIKIQATQDGNDMGSPRSFPVNIKIN